MNTKSTQKKRSRREQQKRETARIIKECAYALFEEKGFERMTMRELASKAGVGLGTIFKHFPDKNALIVSAFKEDITRKTDQVFGLLPDKDLKNQLFQLARYLYTFYAERPFLSKILVKQAIFMEGKAGEEIQSIVFDFFYRVSHLFQSAIERGEVRSDLDCMEMTIAFWSLYLNVLIMGFSDPNVSIDVQANLMRNLLDQLFEGVSAKKNPIPCDV